ncbi:MAG: Transcriptional regulator, ArsR family [Microgenomates group bacterium GW2011_GWC2_46_7]|nr:MAG: Transcriptional regulator, ArsR family [Microgenomates group bacterium GW2011_GWC2_46_7]
MKATVLQTTAKHFKALGHGKRLEIIFLLQGHQLTVNQIVQMTALRQATVSQHLMLLKDLELVVSEKIGKEIYYSLLLSSFQNIANLAKTLTRLTPIENTEPTVVDPICHMHLTPSTSDYTQEYDGVRHYFCGRGCLKEFSHLHKGAI